MKDGATDAPRAASRRPPCRPSGWRRRCSPDTLLIGIIRLKAEVKVLEVLASAIARVEGIGGW